MKHFWRKLGEAYRRGFDRNHPEMKRRVDEIKRHSINALRGNKDENMPSRRRPTRAVVKKS